MATKIFIGTAPKIAQVTTLTPSGTIAVGNTFTVTINNQNIVYTATATTVASVTAGLYALLSASTTPAEFQEITWADTGTAITATSSVPGRPFTVTVSKAQAGGATNLHAFTPTATTANSSPQSIGIASNWSTNSLPATNDTIVFENLSLDIIYDLNALSALINVTGIFRNCTGRFGLDEYNAAGYDEYRPTYFACGFSSITYDCTGSSAKFDLLDPGVTATVTVTRTGGGSVPGLESVLIKGGTASHAINFACNRGSVGVAVLASETAYITTTCNIGYQTGQTTDAAVRFGSLVTFAGGFNQYGGKVAIASSVTNVLLVSGTLTTSGTAAISGTLTNQAGTVILNGSGTVATYDGYGKDTLDLRQRTTAATVTNMKLREGSVIQGTLITNTNPIQLMACGPNDVTLPAVKNCTVAIVLV